MHLPKILVAFHTACHQLVHWLRECGVDWLVRPGGDPSYLMTSSSRHSSLQSVMVMRDGDAASRRTSREECTPDNIVRKTAQ